MSGGGTRAIVNGLSFADNVASIDSAAADNAARAARVLLYDQHIKDSNGRLRSKLNSSYGKDFAAFEADLADLARYGATRSSKCCPS